LMKFLLENYAGSSNIDKPMIVDRNAKWISTQMTGVDAQALETRKYQIEEVCRYFGVMPIMVGYSDKAATYASAEQMFLAHSRDCLAPRWTNYEQAFDTQLLTAREREKGYYFDFVEEGMMRGSLVDTQTTLLGYLNGGVMTETEVREKLDLNPLDGEWADKIRIPANIVGALPEPSSNTTEVVE
jgi:HK97 family phage portal protein